MRYFRPRPRIRTRGAKRGIFAYILHDDPEELASAIDITLQRFAESHSLPGAFGGPVGQAKGILMARHAVTGDRAFEMLESRSQHNRRTVVDVAEAVVGSHLLLLPPLAEPPAARQARFAATSV